MLKPLSLIISIFIILQSFLGFGVMVWFAINQTFIAENLCENRDKPEMQCNGSCVMNEKLSQVDSTRGEADHDPKPVSRPQLNFLYLFPCIKPESFGWFCLYATESQYPYAYISVPLPGNWEKLIKPPQV